MLTENGKLQNKISSPRYKKPKTYWVQVEGAIDDVALSSLRKGVSLKDGITLPAEARLIDSPNVWPRIPPIRERKKIPTSWIELIIREGKNRQVRRMTAAVGFPTLRLIRYSVDRWTLGNMQSGEFRVVEPDG